MHPKIFFVLTGISIGGSKNIILFTTTLKTWEEIAPPILENSNFGGVLLTNPSIF